MVEWLQRRDLSMSVLRFCIQWIIANAVSFSYDEERKDYYLDSPWSEKFRRFPGRVLNTVKHEVAGTVLCSYVGWRAFRDIMSGEAALLDEEYVEETI